MTEIWLALRDCDATETEESWDHAKCGAHQSQFLDVRKEVITLPEAIIEQVVDVLERLTVPDGEAGNLDAPSVFSGSWGQQKSEAASNPSTPETV